MKVLKSVLMIAILAAVSHANAMTDEQANSCSGGSAIEAKYQQYSQLIEDNLSATTRASIAEKMVSLASGASDCSDLEVRIEGFMDQIVTAAKKIEKLQIDLLK